MYHKLLKFLTVFTLVFSLNSFAQDHGHEAPEKDSHNKVEQHGESHNKELTLKEQIQADIKHHLLDSHDFHIWQNFSIPLPIILWDNGLHIFSSSKFHHDKVAEHNGNFYAISHNNGHIYKVNSSNDHIEYNEKGFEANDKPLDLSITKNVVMIIITSLLIFLLFRGLARSYAKNGGIGKGVGRFFEPIVLYIRDEIAIPNIGEKHYRKYMNYLLTIFFFIWFVNLFGLTPLGVNITGNIAITFSLAILTYLITTFTAKKDYWKHIFWMPGVPAPMKIILAPIELLGTFIKPFALMIRLYANMKAGHVVLMSIIGLMFLFKSWVGSPLSFGLAFGLSILELLVAALQAYIFTVLSALYFGSAAEEHSDH
jgi:F-type H+-transporting ATPase subunit a